MTPLADKLHQMIAQDGPMRVEGYMQQCLLDPDCGYYSTKTAIGAEGDFITAPEVSQIFGEMLAAFHAHLYALFQAPETVITFEAGPGRGTLLQDMRRAYQALQPALYHAPCYLLEDSDKLKQQQTEAIAPHKAHHIHEMSALAPAPLFGVANEFFDALGVRQAVFKNKQWHERRIDSDNHGFSFITSEPLTDLQNWQLPASADEGDIIEYSPLGEAIMAQMAHHIAHYGGGLLLIDYGKSDNHGDTLQAVRQHRPSDILSYQGESDITHWVDFNRLAIIAKQQKARLIGPVSQGRFLKELGIGQRAEVLRKADKPEEDRALMAAIDRLVSPAHMGGAFKVCLLVPDGEGVPPGFLSLSDTHKGYEI
ncbi:MAG: class I SAM-dependent methyltransferase [Candidatus Puniceispirillaceae bacterium]